MCRISIVNGRFLSRVAQYSQQDMTGSAGKPKSEAAKLKIDLRRKCNTTFALSLLHPVDMSRCERLFIPDQQLINCSSKVGIDISIDADGKGSCLNSIL